MDRRVHAERLQEEVERRDAEDPGDRLRHAARRARIAGDRRGSRSRGARGSRTSRPGCGPRRTPITPAPASSAEPDQRGALVQQEELPVDGRDARVDLMGRQHTDRERPDQQAARDEEVEDRLDDERRGERRVGRSLDAGLDEVDLDDVAAARRQDRVDADARDVGAERAAVLEPARGVRGAHDVLPGARPEEQLDHVAGEREPEGRPLDVRQVVEEDRNSVKKAPTDLYGRQRTGRLGFEVLGRAKGKGGSRRETAGVPPCVQAPAATRTKSVAKPRTRPARIHQATTTGIAWRRQTSSSWITT